MNNEDMITLFDDNGNSLELAVLEYFLLGGQEYVLLSDMVATDEETNAIDIFVMQVNLLDDETEEFVNIDAKAEEEVYEYAEKLISGKVDEPSEFY